MPAAARWTVRLSLVISILLAGAVNAAPETLRELLAAKNLNITGAKLANLDKSIASGAELDDANQFVIAYYIEDGSGEMKPPIFVERYDRKSKEWTSAALADAQTKSGDIEVDCFGTILSVTAAGRRILLETHINPSAGCLLVLSPGLKLEAGLYGWLEGRLGEDTLIYQRSEVHFAPVHPAELALYDLRSKRDISIFPRKPDLAIRRERALQLRNFYKANEGWCSKNNDPCDPEYFDSELQGPVATNDAEAALAFLISYEQIQYVEGDVQKPPGPKDVLYVYRGVPDEVKMEYREMLLEDAKAKFGDTTLLKLIKPEMLAKIFDQKSSK